MIRFLKKLLIGNVRNDKGVKDFAFLRAKANLTSIWNNDHSEDNGLEKLVRLLLATSQFIFPGLYIKEFFGRNGTEYKDLAIDLFVLVKLLFPIILLYKGWQDIDILFYVMIWFLIETTLYVPTLIFASDGIKRPRSYRRSMLLLFINYIEIVCSFGVIYARGEYLSPPATHWLDPIYYSFVTMSTTGFGDILPVTPLGKVLTIIQSIIYLTFVILFLNFFTHRVESKGYFDNRT